MTGEDSHVRCIGPCSHCTYQESCRPHIERIAVEHAQHVVDVTRAGGDSRFVPRLVLECGAGQFSPTPILRHADCAVAEDPAIP